MTDNSTMETWDGQPVSEDWPHGASIVVYRRRDERVEFLILHRAHAAEPNGDWAWTPPSGARYPGEEIDDCALRELKEETGLVLPLVAVTSEAERWRIYRAEASLDATVELDPEHDRFAWVDLQTAVRKCLPEEVSRGLSEVVQYLDL